MFGLTELKHATRLCSGVTAALALGTSQAAAQTALPCQGTYEAVTGTVTLTGPGPIVVVSPRNRSVGPLHLTYDSCDRIRLVGDGQQMVLTPSATGDGWTGELTDSDARRVYNFDPVTPGLLMSHMTAVGRGGVTVNRGMRLTRISGTENQPEDCILDGDTQDLSVKDSAAEQFLRNRGLQPPEQDLSYRDYFRSNESVRTETAEHYGIEHRTVEENISYLLNIDREFLPASRAGTRQRLICSADPETVDPPRYLLDFKITRVEDPDGFVVFARVIDIETGAIQVQAEAETTGFGEANLAGAMGEAMSGLEGHGVEIGGMTDGIVD